MKYFLKLNVVSILYALSVFIPLELLVNVLRISRLTHWEIGTVNILTCISLIVEMVGCSILLVFLTRKWLGSRKGNFWTIIVWIPYFVFFIYVFASIFPVTYDGDVPNPAMGLLAIGGLIIYPFYILILNFMAMTDDDKMST